MYVKQGVCRKCTIHMFNVSIDLKIQSDICHPSSSFAEQDIHFRACSAQAAASPTSKDLFDQQLGMVEWLCLGLDGIADL